MTDVWLVLAAVALLVTIAAALDIGPAPLGTGWHAATVTTSTRTATH